METTKDECGDLPEFNYDLFTINGEPLKFSLRGFDLENFLAFAKILEAFGAQLSDPHSPNALIFTDRNHPGELSRDCYDIRFFRDCVEKQTIQELEKYRIESMVNQQPSKYRAGSEPRVEPNAAQERDSEKGDTSSDSAESEPSENEESDNEIIQERMEKTKSTDCSAPLARTNCTENQISEQFSQAITVQLFEAPQDIKRNESPATKHIDAKPSTSDGARTKTDGELREKTNGEASSEKIQPTIWPVFSSTPKSFSNMENYRIPRTTGDRPVKSIVRTLLTRKEDEEVEKYEKIEPKKSHKSTVNGNDISSLTLARVVVEKLHDDDEKCSKISSSITNDESELSEGELSDESYTTRQLRELENYQPSLSKQSVETNTTDDNSVDRLEGKCSLENHDQVKSLGDEEEWTAARLRIYDRRGPDQIFSDHRGNEHDIPKHAEGDSEKSQRVMACSSSSKGGTQTTESFPSSSSDDSDSEGGYDSSKNPRKRRRSSTEKKPTGSEGFSEEDNRRMIQYLIDHNKIQRAGVPTAWEGFLSENLQYKEVTTVERLCGHFLQYLQHNLRKYTDDQVMIRKFESRMKFRRYWHYSEEDNRRMVQYLIDNNAINRGGGPTIWKKFLEKNVLDKKYTCAENLRGHFKCSLRKYYWKYTNDEAAFREFEEVNKKFNGKSDKWRRYSHEDNRRMIQYLIDNNAIHLGTDVKIWQAFLAKNVLSKKDVSDRSLKWHFECNLRKNVQAYTDNQTAIREFEKAYAGRVRRRAVRASTSNKFREYSEEDNRRMLQYLIDKNAIHLGRGLAIWRSFLKNNVLDKKTRSASDLSEHYRLHLIDHCRKYVDDPEIIRRIEMEKDKRRSLHNLRGRSPVSHENVSHSC